MQYYAGDFVVDVNQRANRYIVEMLEPQAPESFFVWNYFDAVLESHDFYSVWGFEKVTLWNCSMRTSLGRLESKKVG
ncbi:MAG: hypothetical protein R2744_10610 [Bacteroidales bacterium]